MNAVFNPAALMHHVNTPLYIRIKKLVLESLERGDLASGEAIPAEREVAQMLHVSRVTVRKAFSELVKEGVLTQRRGSGTFVRDREARILQPLSRLTSFTEDMHSRGLKTKAIWLDRSQRLPSPEEAINLSISPSEHVTRFHRLRLADGVPMAIELAVVPHKFLEDPHSVGGSLYAAMEARGFKPVRALQRLHAIALDADDAVLLQQSEGSPALYIERISYLSDGRIAEFTRSIYPGSSYDFIAELTLAPEVKSS